MTAFSLAPQSLPMNLPRLSIILVSTFLAACANEQVRWHGNASGDHAIVDAQAHRMLQDAIPCCRTLADLPYTELSPNLGAVANLGAGSPAFEFESGKSFFAAYRIAGLPRPLILEVAGLAASQDKIHSRHGALLRSSSLAPVALILDSNFQVVRRLESTPNQASCPLVPGGAYTLQAVIGESADQASYLVVATSDSLRRHDDEVLCGVAQHGLSPTGQIQIGVYDAELRNAIDRHGEKHWHGEGVLLKARALFGAGDKQTSTASRDGMLLVGERSLRVFGRALVGYQPVVDIPYTQIVSAKADNGMGWQRAGRRLSVHYRDPAAGDTVHLLVTPISSANSEPFADEIAALIQSRLTLPRLAGN